jgi:hypothetical protein
VNFAGRQTLRAERFGGGAAGRRFFIGLGALVWKNSGTEDLLFRQICKRRSFMRPRPREQKAGLAAIVFYGDVFLRFGNLFSRMFALRRRQMKIEGALSKVPLIKHRFL